MSMTKVTTTQQGLTVMTAPRGGTFRRASLGAPPGRLPRGAGTAAGGGGSGPTFAQCPNREKT